MNIKETIKKIPFLKNIFKGLYLKNKAGKFEKISTDLSPDPKLVLFESFQGRSYSCSPKAIYNYMQNDPRFNDYRFVWVFRDTSAHGKFPQNTTLVKYDSDEALKYYSKAGTWIVNSRLRDFIAPKEGQRYIQCWHGTPFKKIGCDITAAGNATSADPEKIHREYRNEAQKITKLLSPSKFCTEKLTSAFDLKSLGKEDIIIETGYPRNEFLFSCNEDDRSKIKSSLGIPDGKKVLLYCPTFRDNQFSSQGYSLELKLDFQRLMDKFGDDAVILFRAHYFIADKFDFKKYGGFVIDVSSHDDINELFIISDLLITDYSSVFFDYSNLCRPMIFYQYDGDEYRSDIRDTYFGTAMLPGFTVNDMDKLEEVLGKILDDLKGGGDGLLRYRSAMAGFKKRFTPNDKAGCTEQVVNILFGEN